MVLLSRIRSRLTAGLLIKAIGVYSVCVVALISLAILGSDETDVHQKAVIKMALGLIPLYRLMDPVFFVKSPFQ